MLIVIDLCIGHPHNHLVYCFGSWPIQSPFHICDRLTDGLPHALSRALLLFHARPWKHLPQLRHSFCSKGPTPSLSVGCLPGAPSFHRLVDPIDALLSFIVVPATDSFVLFLSTQRQICIVHRRAPSSSRHRRSNRRILLSLLVVVPATESFIFLRLSSQRQILHR